MEGERIAEGDRVKVASNNNNNCSAADGDGRSIGSEGNEERSLVESDTRKSLKSSSGSGSRAVVVVLQDVINVSGRAFSILGGWFARLVRFVRVGSRTKRVKEYIGGGVGLSGLLLSSLKESDRIVGVGESAEKFIFGEAYDPRWVISARRQGLGFGYVSRRRNRGLKNNEMGALLDKPKTDKYNEQGEWNGLRYGLASMQGWRIEMEDAHCAVMGLPGHLKDWAFFAVFDGHAGERVSSHCADNLLETIMQTEQFSQSASEEDVSIEQIKKGIRDGFLLLDDKMRTIPEMASGEDKSGSTAVCVLISPTHMYIANCGDSRSVLCRDGRVCFATQDHKPINPAEKERIQNAGGSVMIQRVNGSLAVSRALGDYEYKNVEGKGPCEQLVSPEPEISVEPRDECHDEFMVLACDGVWDVMSNEDLVEFIRSRLRITNDLSSICNQVIDTCLYKGSRDNMSMVLVTLPACPPPVEEAAAKEAALEELLRTRVTELVKESDGNIELPHILQTLSDESISDLPPGGGLAAKRTFIESVYKVLCPNNVDTMDN